MAQPYTNALAQITAAFPGAAFTPIDVRNDDRNGYTITNEAFTVPASADGEGRYRMQLDQVPNEMAAFSTKVGPDPGVDRAWVPYGTAPAAGYVAVSIETGVIEFNAADAGLACKVSYQGRGTPINAHLLNLIQKELKAVQDDLVAGGGGVSTPGTTVANNVPAWGDTTGDSLVASRLTVRPAGMGDVNTEVLLDGAVIGIWEPGSDRFRFSFGGSPVQHVYGLLKGFFEGQVDGSLASVARVIESAPATSGSIEFDLSIATTWTLETTGVSSISMINAPAGECEVVLLITAGAGSPAVTWPGSVTWATGAAPDLLEGAPVRVVLRTINSGSTWTGYEDRPIGTPASTTVGDVVVFDSITGKKLAAASPVVASGAIIDRNLQRFAITKGLVASAGEWTLEHLSTLQAWLDPEDTANQVVATLAIASWSGSGSVVTVTSAEAHGIAVGESVVIAGAGAINGTHTVASAPTTTTFTIASTETAGGGAAGTVAPANSRISSFSKRAGSLATVATQTAFAKMPKRVVGLNGRNVLRFDGTDDWMALANAAQTGGKGAVVFGFHSAQSKQANLLRASNAALISVITGASYQWYTNASTKIDIGPISNQNPRVFLGGVSAAGNRRGSLNGGVLVSDTGVWDNPSWASLCSNTTGSSDFANGDVFGVAFLSDLPSLAEMDMIGMFFSLRWGTAHTRPSLFS